MNMTCPRCGSPLSPNASFCGGCGMPVVPPPAMQPLPVHPAPVQPPRRGAGFAFMAGCLVVLVLSLAVFFTALKSAFTLKTGKLQGPIRKHVEKHTYRGDNQKAAEEFFSLLDTKDYRAAYDMFDPAVREQTGYKNFFNSMRLIGDKFGKRKSHKLSSVQVRQFYSNGKNAVFYAFIFDTTFEKGSASEKLTIRRVGDTAYIYHYALDTDEFTSPQFGPKEPDDKFEPFTPPGDDDLNNKIPEAPSEPAAPDIQHMEPQTTI